MSTDLADLADLAERVRRIADRRRRARTLIGVAGAPGAGKTTLALALVRQLGGFPAVAHVPMDGFHLADVELARMGRADRKGAPDTFDPDGYAALLTRVRDGAVVWAPTFERDLEQPIAQAIPVTAATRIVVSEGNYLLVDDPQWRRVRDCFDEVWFCREEEPERLRRLVDRHVRFGKTPAEAVAWVERSDQVNAELVAASAARADLVVDLAGADLRD